MSTKTKSVLKKKAAKPKTKYTYGPDIDLDKEVVLDKDRFRSFILKNEIHIAQFVPATLKTLLVENGYMPSLKTIICGGEKLEKSLKKEVCSSELPALETLKPPSNEPTTAKYV